MPQDTLPAKGKLLSPTLETFHKDRQRMETYRKQPAGKNRRKSLNLPSVVVQSSHILFSSNAMGNVEVIVHVTDAEGVQNPINTAIAERNKARRATDFPPKVVQILTNVPGMEITEQNPQLGSIHAFATVERFKMLCTFLEQHPEIGRIHTFQAQDIQDEEAVSTFFREKAKTALNASLEGSQSPSSSERVGQYL